MRITNKYMSNNLMKNLNDNKERLNNYNNQLSTGKQFSLPSDDPTGVATSMDLDSTISQNKQNIRFCFCPILIRPRSLTRGKY